jgi:hypothetical protein
MGQQSERIFKADRVVKQIGRALWLARVKAAAAKEAK